MPQGPAVIGLLFAPIAVRIHNVWRCPLPTTVHGRAVDWFPGLNRFVLERFSQCIGGALTWLFLQPLLEHA